MSYGETYQDVRDDGVHIHVIDLLPGSHDEAKFLKLRAVHIAKELSRVALESDSFDWFSPSDAQDIDPCLFHHPPSLPDTRIIAPVACLATYRKSLHQPPL